MDSHGLDEVATEKVEPWMHSQDYKEEPAKKPREGVSKRWGKLGVLKAAETMRKRRWENDPWTCHLEVLTASWGHSQSKGKDGGIIGEGEERM